LFTKYNEHDITVVLVYVDDIIITENNQLEINSIKNSLKQKFDIKDLEKLKYFLEIKIAHSSKGLFISQRKYTLDLLKETDKLECGEWFIKKMPLISSLYSASKQVKCHLRLVLLFHQVKILKLVCASTYS
jgi:Reverse transcriptase (RNA-dependent DNA polymerase)